MIEQPTPETETESGETLPQYRYTARLANEIEGRWQDYWEAEHTFWAPNPTGPLSAGFEALAGVTRNAARALGLNDRGVLAAGKRADFVLWDIAHPAELSYWIGAKPAHAIVQAGMQRKP